MRNIAVALALLLSCAVAAADAPAPLSDILGVELGMSREEVRSGLAGKAGLEREERRRHEVWTLTNDPRFAALIIGYTKEWTVRFVTAVAKPGGVAVGYADVLDLAAAKVKTAGQTRTYTWATGTPPYSVIAIGGPTRLEYLSLEYEQQ
jgi:hypothetical protein